MANTTLSNDRHHHVLRGGAFPRLVSDANAALLMVRLGREVAPASRPAAFCRGLEQVAR